MEENHSGYRVLVADDDPAVHTELGVLFQREGFRMSSVYNGVDALAQIRKLRPDIVILDIVMPKMDGLMVCREIRKEMNIPIIMLSAKSEEFDRLLGLELGADDYITKPYSPREVVARIKCVLRRVHEYKEEAQTAHLVVDTLDIDRSSYIVRLDGKVIPCTPKELEILWLLAGNPGLVFSREHLLQSIWGYDYAGDTRAVDSHIKRIRAKLSCERNRWDIKTVWGVGYRFEVDNEGDIL